MYARVTYSQISPDKIDDAVSAVRDSIVPLARQEKGFKGYLLMGDRETGKGISITLWETEADRKASDPASAYYREAMSNVAALFTAPPVIEYYEVNLQV